MKKQLIIGLTIALSACGALKAQSNDPVVMEFAGQKITKSEFVKSFKQANNINPEAAPTACTYEKRKALQEYVDLYANFRLRLYDAYAKKYDTATDLRNEYRKYRHEMALPFLIDSTELETLLKQTYERNQHAVRASHIMVKLESNASPKDTIVAYNKAMEIYNKAIAPGADFEKLAIELSEDEQARDFVANNGQKYDGNHGDIGFFTVYQMVPEFENTAFSLKVGEISKPVRSSYGYHIIKLTDKVKAYGNIKFQHIWVKTNDTLNKQIAENKIKEAYKKIQDGDNFGTVVRNYASFIVRGKEEPGLMELPVNQIPPEYLHNIQGLKDGQYTQPFETQWGWHIVKVLHTENIPPFDSLKESYRTRITSAQYGNAPQAKYIENFKKNHKFVDHTIKSPSLLDPVLAALNDTVFQAQWKYNGQADNKKALFEFDGKIFTAHDFAKHIEKTQHRTFPFPLSVYLERNYKSYIETTILETADSLLELNNKEFRSTMNEFRDGLVIFAYNDDNVWSKASSDTAGLREFYNTNSKLRSLDNPNDSNFFWDQRAKTTLVYIADSACLQPQKALKSTEKILLKKKLDPKTLFNTLEKSISKKCTSEHPIGMNTKLIEKKDPSAPKSDNWKIGAYVEPNENKGYKVVCVTQLRDPELKSLRSAKGYYINDYQNFLETQLIENLRKKYNLVIHQDVIDSITW